MVRPVRYKQVPRGVREHTRRRVYPGGDSRGPVPRVARGAAACRCRDRAIGVHSADSGILGVGNVEHTLIVHGQPAWLVQARLGRRSSVSGRPAGGPDTAAADGRRDHAGPVVHTPDPVVPRVSDVQVPPPVHNDAARPVQVCGRGRTGVTQESCPAISGHGRDHARFRVHLSDPVVARICYQQIPIAVNKQPCRALQEGVGGRSPVARETGLSGSHHSLHPPGASVHLPDPVVARVRDVEVPRDVQGNAQRVTEGGPRPGGPVPVEGSLLNICRPAATVCRDRAFLCGPADPVVPAVGNVEHPCRTHVHPGRLPQLCHRGGATVSGESTGRASGCRPQDP